MPLVGQKGPLSQNKTQPKTEGPKQLKSTDVF